MNNPFANLTEYDLKHLVAHLESSELHDELHSLLERELICTEEVPVTRQGLGGWLDRLLGQKRTQQYIWYENAWYAAKQRINDMNGFLNDVERAWRLAEQGQHGQKWGKVIRYALIVTSVNSLAQTIPPALLVAMVEKEIWPPVQGLVYARRIPNPKQQMEALIGLAPHLPSGLSNKTIIAAREIQDEKCRVKALAELVVYLPEKLKIETLREVLAAISEVSDAEWQFWMLTRIIAHMPKDLLGETLAVANSIKNEKKRFQALVNLASHLPESLLIKGLAFAKAIKNQRWRTQAMGGLAVYLPESLKVRTLKNALAMTWEIGDEGQQVKAVAGLANYLTTELIIETIEVIQINIEKWQQRQAPSDEDFYRTLFDHSPNEIPTLMEADSKAKRYENVWMQALAKMAVQLAKLGQPYKAFELIQTIESKVNPIEITIGIVPYLPQTLKEMFLLEVLAKVKELPEPKDDLNNDKSPQVEAMAELAVFLPPELMAEALAIIGSMNGPRWRAEGLTRLAPYLPQNILSEALSLASTIIDEQWRVEALSELALHLSSKLVTEAVAFVEEIEDSQWRAQVLARLALRLAELGYSVEALTTIKSIENEPGVHELIIQGVTGLAPHLSRELLSEAWAITNKIDDQSWQSQALTSLSNYDSVELHKKTLTGEWHPLIEWGKDLYESETTHKEIETLIERGHLAEALAIVQKIPEQRPYDRFSPRLQSLIKLIPHLQADLLVEAVPIAFSIQDSKYRAHALAELSPRLIELPDPVLVTTWRTSLPTMARHTREALLANLSGLAPIFQIIGGSEVVAETTRAIQDVGRWWP